MDYEFEPEFDRAKKKLKDGKTREILGKTIDKILDDPECGKPLRNRMKGCRRVHMGPYVVIYAVVDGPKIVFLTFAPHDEAY